MSSEARALGARRAPLPRVAAAALAAGVVLLVLAGAAAWDAARIDLGELDRRTPFPTAMMRARQAEARRRGASDAIDCRFVPYDRISPLLRRAVLVAEDDAFFQHGGLDWNEIGASGGVRGERRSPAISTDPASNEVRPFRQRRNVLFPPPDGPTIAIVSPRRTSASIPRSTGRPPSA